MSEERPVNRRSFLARVGGAAVLAGGGLALFGPTEAEAQRYCTDRDPYDPVGNGRGRRRRRRYVTDSDPYDPVGRGRG